MGKKLLFALPFVLTVFASSAFSEPKKIQFGVTGGPAFTYLDNSATGVSGNKTGYSLGMFANIPKKESASGSRVEILITSKGAVTGTPERTINLTYLEIPIKYRLMFGQRNTGFGVDVGVGFGFKIAATDESGGRKSDIGKDVAPIDVGLVGGFFYGGNHLGVSLGYNLGLLNVYSKDTETTTRNMALYTMLGYKF